MANFLTTSGVDPRDPGHQKVPVLYYLPRQLTLEQEQIVQKQREAVKAKYDDA